MKKILLITALSLAGSFCLATQKKEDEKVHKMVRMVAARMNGVSDNDATEFIDYIKNHRKEGTCIDLTGGRGHNHGMGAIKFHMPHDNDNNLLGMCNFKKLECYAACHYEGAEGKCKLATKMVELYKAYTCPGCRLESDEEVQELLQELDDREAL